MKIRHIAILAVALTALSACKAVTLQDATVSQPTFGIEAEDWGVPATDQLRQDSYHAPTPTTHPAAEVITTQDLHAMLIGPNPPVTINAVFGKSQVRSIPGSVWPPAAGQGGALDDDIQTRLASTLGNITDDDLGSTERREFCILVDVHPGLASRFVDRRSSPISFRDSTPDGQPIERSQLELDAAAMRAVFCGLLVFGERLTPVATDGGVVAADGGVEALNVIMNAPRQAGVLLQMDSVAFPVVEDGLAGVGHGQGAVLPFAIAVDVLDADAR